MHNPRVRALVHVPQLVVLACAREQHLLMDLPHRFLHLLDLHLDRLGVLGPDDVRGVIHMDPTREREADVLALRPGVREAEVDVGVMPVVGQRA